MAASDMREANTMTEAEARAALAAFDGPGGLQAWIAAEAAKQRARLVLATWCGPAEPRPPRGCLRRLGPSDLPRLTHAGQGASVRRMGWAWFRAQGAGRVVHLRADGAGPFDPPLCRARLRSPERRKDGAETAWDAEPAGPGWWRCGDCMPKAARLGIESMQNREGLVSLLG